MPARTVLITGAARRIGAALARDLHANGMDVVIHYNRSAQEAETLAASLNQSRKNSAFLVQADLLNPETYEKLIIDAAACTGRLDVLINNASVFYPTAVGGTSLQQWAEITTTNTMAPYFLIQACVPYLKQTAGCIINITDIHGMRPLKDYPVYSVSKAGLIMLTKALAKELGPAIRVNAISPGAILWPEMLPDRKKDSILSKTVMKRLGDPQDIANAVRFLITEADYITGQIISVDGGRTFFTD
jgi:pteridine reductase